MGRKSDITEDMYKNILKVSVHVAINQILLRLRETCNELADKMERGDLPAQSGPSALRMIALTIEADRQQRDAKPILE